MAGMSVLVRLELHIYRFYIINVVLLLYHKLNKLIYVQYKQCTVPVVILASINTKHVKRKRHYSKLRRQTAACQLIQVYTVLVGLNFHKN